jgi:catechol 2,3-dioxygenase-like lactoylglutathione lyase family enzyme
VLTGLAHVDLTCRDVETSIAFYVAVLGPLGLGSPPITFQGERGETIHYLRFPAEGSGSIGLRQASEEGEFVLYAPGLHHVAFAVATPEDVRTAHAAAVRAGAEVLHAPRPFARYHPDYYATFFLDPDGFRVEVRSR